MVKVVINRTTTKIVRSPKTRTIKRIQRGDPGIIRISWSEEVSGVIDGSNAVFTIAFAPTGNVQVTMNGLTLSEGFGNDFVLSGQTITFNPGQIPLTGDSILATYSY